MTDTPTTPWPTLPDGRMLVLRTCDAQMRSEHSPSFVWPTSGPVEAPDWDPDPDRDCGGGLHGLLWGCGNASMLSSSSTVRWLVVAVDPADIANPDAPGKVRGGPPLVRGRHLLAWDFTAGGERSESVRRSPRDTSGRCRRFVPTIAVRSGRARS